MSILNGNIHSSLIHVLPDAFGQTLQQTDYVPINQGMEVCYQPETCIVFAGHFQGITAFHLANGKLQKLGTLPLWGGIRQMALLGHLLAATARDEGAYLIDVSNASKMKLLKRLDTLELATGVCLYDSLCLIANRHAGVEVWDVSRPETPTYLSSFLAGEAQSVFMDRKCAYVGDWMNKRLLVFDLKNPYAPRKLADVQVDGFADGVWVKDGLCFVASGHNNQHLKNRTAYWGQSYMTAEMVENGFGCGHALTCFDVSDPAQPEYMSQLTLPPLFTSHPDTWRVTLSGDFAYVSDANNGVFVVDIRDPFAMNIVAHRKLGLLPQAEDPLAPRWAAASAAVPANGCILAIGPHTGLHVLTFPQAVPSVLPSNEPYSPVSGNTHLFFSCAGQIHSLATCGDALLAACGDDGLYALAEDGSPLHHLFPQQAVRDVQVFGEFILTAEGNRGIGVYHWDMSNGFHLLKHLPIAEGSVRQMVVSPALDGMALALTSSRIAYAAGLSQQLAAPEGTPLQLQSFKAHGPMYDRHLVAAFYHNHFAAMPLSSGFTWFEINGATATELPYAAGNECCPFEEGVAVSTQAIYVVHRRKLYVLKQPGDPLDAARTFHVPKAQLKGQPIVCEDHLLLLNRVQQTIEQLDISDPSHPVFRQRWLLNGHPLHVITHKGRLLAACGHAGIFKLED